MTPRNSATLIGGLLAPDRRLERDPVRSSITRKRQLSSVCPTSMISMMFGWLTRALTFASIRKRRAASGVRATAGSMNLMANWRSVKMLVADQTEAIPPLPRS